MAVFSKFAVSVVAVAVGYEEEHCETAFALRMEKLGPSGAIPQDSILQHGISKVEVVDLTRNDVGLKQHFLGNEDKLQVEHLDAFKITKQSPPILDVSLASEPQMLNKGLRQLKDEVLTEKNLEVLKQKYGTRQKFFSALRTVLPTYCTSSQVDAVWKQWENVLRCSAQNIWESVEAEARTVESKTGQKPGECDLLKLRKYLEEHLQMMKRNEEKKLGELKVLFGIFLGLGGFLICFFLVCFALNTYAGHATYADPRGVLREKVEKV